MTRDERRAFFKEVALKLLESRPMGVVKGTAGGDIVCPAFLRDICLITENLLAEADKFEMLSEAAIDTERAVRTQYDKRQKEYASIPRVTVNNWREDFSRVAQKVIIDNTELLQELAKSEGSHAADDNKATKGRRRGARHVRHLAQKRQTIKKGA